jgi:hypothetical protein
MKETRKAPHRSGSRRPEKEKNYYKKEKRKKDIRQERKNVTSKKLKSVGMVLALSGKTGMPKQTQIIPND